MSFSFRVDNGTKVTVHVETMSIEELSRYMDYIDEKGYVADTTLLYKPMDRRK